jgi:Caspase domain
VARYALIVGVSKYANAFSPLPGVAQDVQAMSKVLSDPELGDYTVTQLLDPGTARLSEAIESFYRERRSDDVLVFYFSGHGLKDERGQLYFAPICRPS